MERSSELREKVIYAVQRTGKRSTKHFDDIAKGCNEAKSIMKNLHRNHGGIKTAFSDLDKTWRQLERLVDLLHACQSMSKLAEDFLFSSSSDEVLDRLSTFADRIENEDIDDDDKDSIEEILSDIQQRAMQVVSIINSL